MKTNQEILDEFGKKVIEYVYDDNFKFAKEVIKGQTKWGIGKEYTDIFNKLDNSDNNIILRFLDEQIKTGLFSFLSIFEENEEFKIIYEEGGKQVNLLEVSEMLKGEPSGEDGWITRFSKEVKGDEIV